MSAGARVAWGCAAALTVSALAGCGGGDDAGEPEATHSVRHPANPAPDAFVDAGRAMGELEDYTYRGAIPLPADEPNPLAGHTVTTTQRVTHDGRCETVLSDRGSVLMTRRSIDGSMYQRFSDEFLATAELDAATKAALRGRWTVQADNPDTTCDQTRLAGSVDLETASTIGACEVRGEACTEYAATAKADGRVSVHIFVATDGEPLVLRSEAWIDGEPIGTTLTSYNDGFTIEEPPADEVVRPSA